MFNVKTSKMFDTNHAPLDTSRTKYFLNLDLLIKIKFWRSFVSLEINN